MRVGFKGRKNGKRSGSGGKRIGKKEIKEAGKNEILYVWKSRHFPDSL
jgi:hypothetical protein